MHGNIFSNDKNYKAINIYFCLLVEIYFQILNS